MRGLFGIAIASLAIALGSCATSRESAMTGRFEELQVGTETARVYVAGDPGRPRVLVLHPWWGLNEDVTRYADRLAAEGFHVVAPDLFRGRVASTIAEAESLIATKDSRHAENATRAAMDRLASPDSARFGVIGFSLGAAYAIWAASAHPGVAGVVLYYGSGDPADVPGSSAPVLGHFAENDPYEPDEYVRPFEQAIRNAGREVTFHRYAGTGHWFAEPSQSAWRKESADLAFARTVAFVGGRLTPSP